MYVTCAWLLECAEARNGTTSIADSTAVESCSDRSVISVPVYCDNRYADINADINNTVSGRNPHLKQLVETLDTHLES